MGWKELLGYRASELGDEPLLLNVANQLIDLLTEE